MKKTLVVAVLILVCLPAPASAGARIAFGRTEGRDDGLFTIFPSGRGLLQVSGRHESWYSEGYQPVWDAAHTRLLFTTGADTSKIGMVGGDGSNERLVTDTDQFFGDIEPTWAPGGKRIAFVRHLSERARIMRKDLNGKAVDISSRHTSFNPSWAPDGSRIAFTGNTDRGTNLFVMTPDGSDETQLTSHRGGVTGFVWSPDANKIAYVRCSDRFCSRTQNPDIFVVNVVTGLKRQLTSNGGEHPVWSPDGKRIAFVSDRRGSKDVYSMRANGEGVERLTRASKADTEPAWSPDGDHIAWISRRDGNAELYVMKADGTKERRLTRSGDNETSPAWGPEGSSNTS